ncbi:ATP-binding cassette domain-containing protein [Kibdelosporangium philippinense]|uniref:ATP-binding cassette domain-containing protein n=1 Tax=Kibdelosporangium philippinense TaxID=211113 RepID=UPI0036176E61
MTTPMLEVADFGVRLRADRAHRGTEPHLRSGHWRTRVHRRPVGCGKSTLLRCIAGLIKPSAGTVSLHGDKIDRTRKTSRWSSRTTAVRCSHGFRYAATSSSRCARVASRAPTAVSAEEALEWVGLSGAGAKYPWQLSGGMQQRVSIARALACQLHCC